MSDGLNGSVLVTGGTGALGTAVCRELLEAGARVVASWVVESERDDAAAEFAGEGMFELIEADLSTGEGARAAARATASDSSLIGLVNVAGGYGMGERIHETDPEEIERMLELNLMTAYRATRACLPAMLEARGGSIVCVSTRAAVDPYAGVAGYAVSKAAILAFVRQLDTEYRAEGIRANAILPSVIDTPANRESMPDADFSEWVDPAEIARVIRFLVSDSSKPTSGAEIPVYGLA